MPWFRSPKFLAFGAWLGVKLLISILITLFFSTVSGGQSIEATWWILGVTLAWVMIWPIGHRWLRHPLLPAMGYLALLALMALHLLMSYQPEYAFGFGVAMVALAAATAVIIVFVEIASTTPSATARE